MKVKIPTLSMNVMGVSISSLHLVFISLSKCHLHAILTLATLSWKYYNDSSCSQSTGANYTRVLTTSCYADSSVSSYFEGCVAANQPFYPEGYFVLQ